MISKPYDPSPLEQQLLQQLVDIEKKISELDEEKRAIQRLISKVRSQSIPIDSVTRKNSFSKIVIESKILESLRISASPISSKDLYKIAISINYSLKQNTFRSYLHRMKEKGLIEPLKNGGPWRIQKK